MSNESNSGSGPAKMALGAILQKAVGAYVSAEETVKGTLNQIPTKDFLKDILQDFFNSYKITVHAEIELSPKNGTSKKGE